jgi:Type III restriction enzyme, res subunit
MTIMFLDSLAGSGKTRALTKYADRLARLNHKVLFVQPTMHLIEKTIADELRPLDPQYPFRAIHGGTVGTNSVVGNIVDHTRSTARDVGEMLFITHAAFFRLPYIERKDDWVLLMDEAPEVDKFEEFNLSETHHLITPHLTVVPGGPVYGFLVANEDLLAENEEDAA